MSVNEQALVIRFAGDSGDGIQVAGQQFTQTLALSGQHVYAYPDFPAEIRSPAGTVMGVSGFQAKVASEAQHTVGEHLDVLVALNPAAAVMHANLLKSHGLFFYNADQFTSKDFKKAAVAEDFLQRFTTQQVIAVPLTQLTRKAVAQYTLSHSQAARCKNMFVLGMVYWMFDKTLQHTVDWLADKFAQHPEVRDANIAALSAGRNFAETTDCVRQTHSTPNAKLTPGVYRQITGNQALALGCVSASVSTQRAMFFSGYPITPASTLLQNMQTFAEFGVKVFQAEDEIAAACAAIGAAYGGALAACCTSGPGLDLKTESLGLAVMSELPLVVFNIQRCGPATGMPTKTEQTDLLSAIMGRHGEAALPVLAPATPSDGFDIARKAFELAIRFMTPVIVLSDAALANGLEPWRVPEHLAKMASEPNTPADLKTPRSTKPRCNSTLAPPWVIPGTANAERVLGGLETDQQTGLISYEADNHQAMVQLRADKIQRVQPFLPECWYQGPSEGEVLLVSWGSTFGIVSRAAAQLRAARRQVAVCHLRGLWPLPQDLSECFARYQHVIVVELNLGQLHWLLQAHTAQPLVALHQVTGQPLQSDVIINKVEEVCA